MQQFRFFSTLSLLALLTACEGTVYALRNAEATTSRSIANFSDRVNPQPQQLRRPAEPRYCYITMGDTVCYRDPLPGSETRLVGYQEPLVPVEEGKIVAMPARSIRNETPVAQVGSSVPVRSGASFSNNGSSTSGSVNVPGPPAVMGTQNEMEPLRLVD